MDRSKILLLALSLVLIVCLVLVVRSCAADRTAAPTAAPSAPAATRKPIPTFAPSPTPEPSPEPTPEPEPEALPFAEEKGFRFEQPAEHEIPAVQASTLKEAKYKSVRATVSAPRITRSAPDAEGFVTWEIRYTTTAEAAFVMPSDKSVDAFCVFAGGYDLIDYESGRILNSRDSGNLQDERTYTRQTELDGENGSFPVHVSEQARCSWGKWQFVEDRDRVSAVNRAVVEAVLTVRAPADYDGLVLGLDVKNAEQIPDDPFAEDAAPAEVPELWDGSAEDWIFVRASEWIGEAAADAAEPDRGPEATADRTEEEKPDEPTEEADVENPDDTADADELPDGELEETEETEQ